MADLTNQVLIEIRDEIRSTNARLDQTNARLERVERRQVEGELRLGTEIATLTGVMRELHQKLIEDHTIRDVVTDHERRLVALEHRT